MTGWDAETIRERFVEHVAGLPGMAGEQVSKIEYYLITTTVDDFGKHADAVYGAESDFQKDNPGLPPVEFRVAEKAALDEVLESWRKMTENLQKRMPRTS